MSCHLSHKVSDTQVTDLSKLFRYADIYKFILHQYDDVIVHKQPHHQLKGSNNFTQLATKPKMIKKKRSRDDFRLFGEIIRCNSHHHLCLKTSAAF